MGVYESNNDSVYLYNKVKIDEEEKDISTDYLLKDSIKIPIKTKYKLIDTKIGQGTYGKVLLGLDKLGQIYAIKIIKKKKIIKGQLLANEVRIGLKMNHPNILGIKEVYEDMKTISLVMEYCEGGDLFDYITKNPNRKLDDMNTIDIIIQILNAINYLHNTVRVVHRDIKPENILIIINSNNRPTVKLIDFGSAQFIDKEEKMKGKFGTIMYMAPEILMKKPYDEKIDIWSAGIILYNMMSGREPFSNGDSEFKKFQIVFSPINFGILKNNDLRELCQEMMERNPMKRINAKTALEKALMIKAKLLMKYYI